METRLNNRPLRSHYSALNYSAGFLLLRILHDVAFGSSHRWRGEFGQNFPQPLTRLRAAHRQLQGRFAPARLHTAVG